MKIVIDIHEEVYKEICDKNYYSLKGKEALRIGVINGNVLPKGHGRILDEKDILDTENNDGGWYDLYDMPEYIAGVKAIVEADKAESEG